MFDALDKANGDGGAQEGFDGMIRFGLEVVIRTLLTTTTRSTTRRWTIPKRLSNQSVTNDDINYEISRQYNPVFTGGANVLRKSLIASLTRMILGSQIQSRADGPATT